MILISHNHDLAFYRENFMRTLLPGKNSGVQKNFLMFAGDIERKQPDIGQPF